MRTLSFKVDDQEEKAIRFRMHVAGETNLSAHLRRVVLSSGNENTPLLGAMARQLDRMSDAIERNHKLLRQSAQKRDTDVELSLLAGMYLMLYGAAEPGVRTTVDRYLDVKSIRGLLGDYEEDVQTQEVEQKESQAPEEPVPMVEAELPIEKPVPNKKPTILNPYLIGRGKLE